MKCTILFFDKNFAKGVWNQQKQSLGIQWKRYSSGTLLKKISVQLLFYEFRKIFRTFFVMIKHMEKLFLNQLKWYFPFSILLPILICDSKRKTHPWVLYERYTNRLKNSEASKIGLVERNRISMLIKVTFRMLIWWNLITIVSNLYKMKKSQDNSFWF